LPPTLPHLHRKWWRARAMSVFDMLRHYRYRIIRFADNAWIGRNTQQQSQVGGASWTP